MRVPFLLGVTVLFWGGQCGFLPYAAVMAAALEASQVLKVRWALRDRDFEHISDLSAVLLAGVTLYQFNGHGFYAIFPILESVPFVFFPLVLAQRFSTRDRISYAALFLSIRRGLRQGRIQRALSVDVGYPFFIVCLLASSAGHRFPRAFLPGLAVLVAWALWAHRPDSARARAWLLALASALGLAYAGQAGIIAARDSVEPLLVQLFQERLWARRDPYRAHTALGYIGQLKVSQRIVARVRPGTGEVVPARLREAAYRVYSRRSWFAPDAKLLAVDPSGGGSIWSLSARPPGSRPVPGEVRLSSSLPYGRGMLLVPNGTYRVQGLEVGHLKRNGLGAIEVLAGPELAEFTVRFAPEERFVDPPGQEDLGIPEDQAKLFTSLAGRLGLVGLTPAEAVRRIYAYFAEDFSYSLSGRGLKGTEPLGSFLNDTHRGHCEYFATATVLLLRAAGIPARYVTGYAVSEWSPLEQAFVIRRRHAHAWASAYLGDAWRDVDTTPGGWLEQEADESPWWTAGYDVLAWLRYRFDRWRFEDSARVPTDIPLALVLLLSLWLGWRLLPAAGRKRRQTAVETGGGPRAWPGADSELYAIEAELRPRLGARAAHEPLGEWLRHASERGTEVPGMGLLLEEILPRHYRYRFDPTGLDAAERRALREAARRWLMLHRAGSP